MTEHLPAVVVGAGQAGLAAGYHLRHAGLEFQILAADERIGDTWRRRWDSLRLFTPAFFNGLPGMEFPADDPDYLPTKDEVADYLETYAETFRLPVRLDTRVHRVRGSEDGYAVDTDDGRVRTPVVVVATGAFSRPKIPSFADQLPDSVFTAHSSRYRNPGQLRDGDVLVVGAGNSGTQISTEVAATDPHRNVWLAGRDTGRLPRRLLGRDLYRWLAPLSRILSRDTFLGRRLYRKLAGSGDPVFSTELEKMKDTGVRRIGRIEAVSDGRPATGEGEILDVSNVLWCTGFRQDFSWIDLDVFDEDGRPRHRRGVVPDAPGLYFVGLRWLHRLSSSLMGGVGRDARHVVSHIRREEGGPPLDR